MYARCACIYAHRLVQVLATPKLHILLLGQAKHQPSDMAIRGVGAACGKPRVGDGEEDRTLDQADWGSQPMETHHNTAATGLGSQEDS